MPRRLAAILLAALMIMFMVQVTSAHVPVFPGDGTTLETAIPLEDPSRSWVIYSELHEMEEPQYFLIEAEAGLRIKLSLIIPMEYLNTAFRPNLVLMGPGLTSSGAAPAYLETPLGAGVVVIGAGEAEPEYEGFTPTSFLALSETDVIANETGDHYVSAYDTSMAGRYGIVVGYREEFSPGEFILVPFSVIGIHLWEGQSIILILLPFLVLVSIGSILFLRMDQRKGEKTGILTWFVRLGAILFISSGGSTVSQMILAVSQAGANWQIAVTTVFGLLPILTGIAALRVVRRRNWISGRASRIRLLLLGALALFIWAGLVVGPALLVFSSLASGLYSSPDGTDNDRARSQLVL